LANNTWGVPAIIDGSDMANPKVDEQSVMTYIAYFREIDPSKRIKTTPDALDSSA
jgi:hypothetical protein